MSACSCSVQTCAASSNTQSTPTRSSAVRIGDAEVGARRRRATTAGDARRPARRRRASGMTTGVVGAQRVGADRVLERRLGAALGGPRGTALHAQRDLPVGQHRDHAARRRRVPGDGQLDQRVERAGRVGVGECRGRERVRGAARRESVVGLGIWRSGGRVVPGQRTLTGISHGPRVGPVKALRFSRACSVKEGKVSCERPPTFEERTTMTASGRRRLRRPVPRLRLAAPPRTPVPGPQSRAGLDPGVSRRARLARPHAAGRGRRARTRSCSTCCERQGFIGACVAPVAGRRAAAPSVGRFTFLLLGPDVFADDAGVERVRAWRRVSPSARVKLVVPAGGRPRASVLVRAMRAGVNDVLDPDDARAIAARIAGGLRLAGATRERVLAIGAHPDDVEIGCARDAARPPPPRRPASPS